jgi:hypothetical protein
MVFSLFYRLAGGHAASRTIGGKEMIELRRIVTLPDIYRVFMRKTFA